MAITERTSWQDIFQCAMYVLAKHREPIQPELVNNLRYSAQTQNLEVLRDPLQNPIGFVASVRVSKETLNVILHTFKLPRYAHEWDDGYFYIVYHVAFAPNWGRLGAEKFKSILKRRKLFGVIRNNRILFFRKQKGIFKKIYRG